MKTRVLATFIAFAINLAIGTILFWTAFKIWRYEQYAYEMNIIEVLEYIAIFLTLGYLMYFWAESVFIGIRRNIILKVITGIICCAAPPILLKRFTAGINLRNSFDIAELIIFVLLGILIPVITNAIVNMKKLPVE